MWHQIPSFYLGSTCMIIDVIFRQIEIVLKDSAAFVYLTAVESFKTISI